MLKNAWREKFPEFANSSESLEALLLGGKLREDLYISWASEHYKIPSVDKVFFNQIKNLNIIAQNPSTSWTNSFFPVHEWQGMLYIACIEPREIQIEKKYCLVLGSYQEMVTLWNKMERPLASVPPRPAAIAPPRPAPPVTVKPAPPATGVKPLAPTPPSATTQTSFTQTATMPTTGRTAPAQNELTQTDIGKPVMAPPVSQPTPPVTQASTPKPPPAQKPPPPHVAAEDPFSASVVIPLKELDERLQKAAVEHEAAIRNEKDSDATKSNINFNPHMTSGGFKLPEITNVFKVAGNKDMTFTTTKTIMPFPESTKDFTFIRTVYSEHVIGEARSRVQDNREPQEALISAFKILKDYYRKLMWVVRDEKGRAYPIACNDEWAFTEEAWNMPVNFKAANPFRLAKFTQRPYHGSVYKSPVNDQYFDQWNGGKYPDIMTIIPVKMGGKVFGYFVGCDKGPHFHKDQTLETMENVCTELVQTFQRIHEELSVKKKPA